MKVDIHQGGTTETLDNVRYATVKRIAWTATEVVMYFEDGTERREILRGGGRLERFLDWLRIPPPSKGNQTIDDPDVDSLWSADEEADS